MNTVIAPPARSDLPVPGGSAEFLEHAPVAIHSMSAAGTILWANRAELEMLGYPAEEYVGQPIAAFHADPDVLADMLDRLARGETLRDREVRLRARDGSIRHVLISTNMQVQDGRQIGSRCFMRDITERKRVEAELQAAKAAAEEAATHDPLTTLWNHNRIIETLMEELSRADRQGSPVSLAMVDLDHFKQVNDTYGHVVGDEVLREVAERLQRAIRTYDAVGRFGGEEFMVVFPGTDEAEAQAAAERIRSEIGREPILTTAGALSVTASVGVVTRIGEVVDDATALLVAADSALYDAKEGGRDRVTVASMQPN